ncbi:MAG TPA: Uma2 family endonuclease [Fimbriiglobus sp.]|nr:Uma2 family endonuclease [Fimbriiglobus sp.]
MTHATKPEPRFDNLGELLENMTGLLNKLGGIPAGRVRLNPFPGTATKRDLVRLHSREDKLYELVDRTLVEKPMGSPESYLATEVIWQFRKFLDDHDLGFLYAPDALIEILPDLVRGPDVCFVPWTKRPERTVPTEPISDLIPDLAVEVLSPSNTRGEILRKLKEYFLAGVELVWVIDPIKRTADVHTAPDVKKSLDNTGTLDGGDVLPGFRLPLAKLFERLEKPKGKKPRKTK